MIKGKTLIYIFLIVAVIFWGGMATLYWNEFFYYQDEKKQLIEGREQATNIYSLGRFIDFIRNNDRYVSILFYSLDDSKIHYQQSVSTMRNSGKLSFFLFLDDLSHKIDDYALRFSSVQDMDRHIKKMVTTLNEHMIQQIKPDIDTLSRLEAKVNSYDVARIIDSIFSDTMNEIKSDNLRKQTTKKWLRQRYSVSPDFPLFFGLYDVGHQYINLAGVGEHPVTKKRYIIVILSDELPLFLWAHFKEHGMYKDLFARLILNPSLLNK